MKPAAGTTPSAKVNALRHRWALCHITIAAGTAATGARLARIRIAMPAAAPLARANQVLVVGAPGLRREARPTVVCCEASRSVVRESGGTLVLRETRPASAVTACGNRGSMPMRSAAARDSAQNADAGMSLIGELVSWNRNAGLEASSSAAATPVQRSLNWRAT